MSERVAVVGTGTWGTTLAVLLAHKGIATSLWCRTEEEAERLRAEGQNTAYLPGIALPLNLTVTPSMRESVGICSVLLMVAPAQMVRVNARAVREVLPPEAVVVSCAKGLELVSAKRMSEVLDEEIPSAKRRIAVLSGPNLGREIAAGLPAASVVAASDERLAERLRDLLMTARFRVYTNSDLIGVELAGALKNIIALGAGFCDGLRVGDNAKAAFIGRGLLEIARLGVAAGAKPLTFAGLAGLGDVIATCASPQSRNRYVGEQLAKGHGLAEVQRGMRMVAEGVATTPAARKLAEDYGVEMPIVQMTYSVLFEGKDPNAVLTELMTRDPKDEFAGMMPK